ASRAAQILAKLHGVNYMQAWRAGDVPAQFRFTDPTRLGDVVALLSPRYNFTRTREAATRPATGNKGAHGFDPAACPEMLGGAILWRYKHSMTGASLS